MYVRGSKARTTDHKFILLHIKNFVHALLLSSDDHVVLCWIDVHVPALHLRANFSDRLLRARVERGGLAVTSHFLYVHSSLFAERLRASVVVSQ